MSDLAINGVPIGPAVPTADMQIVSMLEQALRAACAGQIIGLGLIISPAPGKFDARAAGANSATDVYAGAGLLMRSLEDYMRGAQKPSRIMRPMG